MTESKVDHTKFKMVLITSIMAIFRSLLHLDDGSFEKGYIHSRLTTFRPRITRTIGIDVITHLLGGHDIIPYEFGGVMLREGARWY